MNNRNQLYISVTGTLVLMQLHQQHWFFTLQAIPIIYDCVIQENLRKQRGTRRCVFLRVWSPLLQSRPPSPSAVSSGGHGDSGSPVIRFQRNDHVGSVSSSLLTDSFTSELSWTIKWTNRFSQWVGLVHSPKLGCTTFFSLVLKCNCASMCF